MALALLALILVLATGAPAPVPAAAGRAALGAPAAAAPTAPAAPDVIRAYRESGDWDRDITAAIDRATQALTTALAGRRPARPAIVLDIDDTSLSNYACLERVDFDRARAGCGSRTDLPPILPTRGLARLAQDRGVELHFVTGRRERARGTTTENLRRAGYTGRWRLHMRPDRQTAAARDGWKARTRRALTRDGRTILVNVGDQRSDLRGGWARHTFRLPNPMYAIPIA